MNIPLDAIPVPLYEDDQSGLRVVGTRVQLERIIHAWRTGVPPERIVKDYDTLNLPAVYAVVAWYLRHQEQVDEYLRLREDEAQAIRAKIEASQPDHASEKARMLARARGTAHAAPVE